jgi:tRNA-2-methylthio-N6-dimethylallyladenosine synthase
MNRAESERLEARLASNGYSLSSVIEEADVIVINSCVVRKHAEDKVVNKLYNLKPIKRDHPGLRIALTGCFVGQDTNDLKKRFPYVDDFLKPGEIPLWLEKEECSVVLSQNSAITAFVPIIQGCNNFCSYCIVPYRRGREVSRSVSDIVYEVREMIERGTKQVTLVGQNVNSYGHDLTDQHDLATLLEELNRIDGLLRIRFLTNHPKDMSPRLMAAMARLEKVCHQINLPVQAGDNAILKAMNRGYNVEDFRKLVGKLRSTIPDITISTDVIVGFPGENEEQFQRTYSLLEELKLDAVHSASYSPRPGTVAAKQFADDVPTDVKKARLATIEKLQEQISMEINASMLGQTVEVLVEAKQKGRWQGRVRSDKLVFFTGGANLEGHQTLVKINKTGPWSLQGVLNKNGEE